MLDNKSVENAVVIDELWQIYLIKGNKGCSVNIKGIVNLKISYLTHNHPKKVIHYLLSAFDIEEFMEIGI